MGMPRLLPVSNGTGPGDISAYTYDVVGARLLATVWAQIYENKPFRTMNTCMYVRSRFTTNDKTLISRSKPAYTPSVTNEPEATWSGVERLV